MNSLDQRWISQGEVTKGEAVADHVGPVDSDTLGYRLEGWDVGLEDDGEGGEEWS